ncbi:unnamed protein product [Haemonchus placei]|uniref:Uncharacterized protein n=1 Tax=Haemonchus placei TaxID=6290 RepID=A0A0N4VXG0_HAEPC|nr:unnamed protein product [Haemonchus placei]
MTLPLSEGPFQLIRPMLRNKIPHITYSLLCCAFYKKQLLFDAVKDVALIENGEPEDYLPMPTGYGYAAPRLIFAFITFGNKIIGKQEVESDVQLLEFQFLVI